MKYTNNGKTYDVESVIYNDSYIQVNGTTIKDLSKLPEECMRSNGYTVFCDSDEIGFATFEEAYDFAMNQQKDTFSVKTEEEMIKEFISAIKDIRGYWLEQGLDKTETLDGFIHSFMSMIDGCSGVNGFKGITLVEEGKEINPTLLIHEYLYNEEE